MPVYLEGVAVQFYRGIGPETQYIAPFSDMNFFVGANNAGKSVVLNLIKDRLPSSRFFMGPLREPTQSDELDLSVSYRGTKEGLFSALYCVPEKVVYEGLEGMLQLRMTHGISEVDEHEKEFDAKFFEEVLLEKGFSPRNAVAQLAKDGAFWIKLSDRQPVLDDVHNKAIVTTAKSMQADEGAQIWWSGVTGVEQPNAQRLKFEIDRIVSSYRQHLPERLLVPAKRELGAGDDTFDDLSGKGLIKHLAEIQNPDHHERERKAVFDQINAFVQEVTGKPHAQLEVPNHRQHLLVHMDNKVLPLSSLGTGIHEVILIAAFCTIHQEKIMCIEEPEIHLHPVLQRKLINYLRKNTRNQYFIATHSAAFIDTPDASVFHVRNDGVQTYVTPAIVKGDKRKICDELGYLASDILQANAVIWVEGPSDRIYIRRWLQEVDADLLEGVHYSIMFYGGGLIKHLSADDEALDDFIKLRDLNRNIAVVIDSDRDGPDAELKPAAARIRQEMAGDAGVVWITEGREIENYLPHDQLQAALKQKHPHVYGKPSSGGPYDRAFCFERKGAEQKEIYKDGDKVGAATLLCAGEVDLGVLDLRDRIAELANMIRRANGPA